MNCWIKGVVVILECSLIGFILNCFKLTLTFSFGGLLCLLICFFNGFVILPALLNYLDKWYTEQDNK